jgi:hypothetical protein
MAFRILTSVAVALALISTPALACKGRNTIMSDDFAKEDASWQAVWGEFSVANGRGQLKSEPGNAAMVLNGSDYVESGDICVDLIAPNARNLFAGIVFNAVVQGDAAGLYTFIANINEGTVAVGRLTKGKFLLPVGWRKSDAINQRANATNTLRLTWKGNNATAYVNDKQVASFGVQSQKETYVGLLAWPEAETFQFDNFKVTD